MKGPCRPERGRVFLTNLSSMQTTFNGGYLQFASLRLDESQVHGYGAAVAPRMLIQFNLDLSVAKIAANRRIDLRWFTSRLQFGDVYVDGIPSYVPLSLSERMPSYNGYSVQMEFPTTPAVIAAIERERAGGNVKVGIWAYLEYEDVRLVCNDPNDQQSQVWGVARRERMQAHNNTEFPASAWTARVLPHVGYGVVHILEFPAAPLEEYEGFAESFKSLKQAQERHAAGLYDDAASKCRIALDKFFETVEVDDGNGGKKKRPKLKASWETRLGKSTFEWLDCALGAVKGATNTSHHSPNEHFDQLESQMLIGITTALVAYTARSAGAEKKDKAE